MTAEMTGPSTLRMRIVSLQKRHDAAALAFLVRVASAGLVFALQVLLARTLPLETYGWFVTLSTWIIVLAGFAVLGFGESAQRFMPRYAVRGRWRDVNAFFTVAFCSAIGLATLGVALTILSLPLWSLDDEVQLVIVLICLGLPFTVADFFLEGAGRAMGWLHLAIIPTYIVQPVLIIAVIGALVLSGVALNLVAASLIFISTTAFLTTIKGVLIVRRLRRKTRAASVTEQNPAKRHGQWAWQNHWVRASLPLMAVYGMDDFLLYSDVLLLGLMSSPQDVGLYIAAVRCLAIANFIHYAFMMVAARKFSMANSIGDRALLQADVLETSRMTFWLTVPAVLITVAAGYPLLHVFGEAFVAAWPLMLVLGAGLIVRSSIGQAFDLLAVMGHARAIVWVSVGCLISNLVLSMVLIPLWGMMGAAIATTVVMTIRAVSLAVASRRLTGISVLAFASPNRSYAR